MKIWVIIAICAIAGIAFMVISLLEVKITEFQILIAGLTLVFMFFIGIVYYYLKNRTHGSLVGRDYISEALNYAIEWGRKHGNMELEYVDGSATRKSFPPDKEVFVGMRLNRIQSDPFSPGQPVTFVIGTKPLSVADFHDNPSSELLKNPFKVFASKYSGAPTPNALPSHDASFYQSGMDSGRGNIYIGGRGIEKPDNFFRRNEPDED